MGHGWLSPGPETQWGLSGRILKLLWNSDCFFPLLFSPFLNGNIHNLNPLPISPLYLGSKELVFQSQRPQRDTVIVLNMEEDVLGEGTQVATRLQKRRGPGFSFRTSRKECSLVDILALAQ